MNSEKYIGLDVHQATIVVAVTDSTGKLVMESILETEAATILQFFAGLRGNLAVTFEEGTWSAWLYDLLNPHVEKLVVCNPRKNALLKDGNKSDRIDARKLAELLRGNQLKPVYHGENGVRMLRELSRSYLATPLSKLGFDLNFLNWIIEFHYCFICCVAVRGKRWDGSGSNENGAVRLGCDYGRTMRVWVLLPSFLNSVRRKSKNPRESGRPELRSRASRKTKTSAFRASLSCR